MKGYLQRLADRAQGVSMTPSIVPARHSLITREPGSDPFTGDQPSQSFSSAIRSPGHVHDSLISPDAEISQPSVMVPGSRRAWHSESAISEAGSGTADIKPASNSRQRTIQPTQDEGPSPGPRNAEPAQKGGDTAEQWPEINSTSTLLSPAQDIAKFATQPRDETTQLVAPSTLEPRTPDIVRPQIPPPEEPRLVIGQLRVDVVPTPSSQKSEVVRTITRMVGPNQTRTANHPISKLRFGLGQM